MASHELMLLVLSPGTDYYWEALGDPVGFVRDRGRALDRVAGERLHEARKLPLNRLTSWAVVLPDAGDVSADLATVRGLYGDELADALEAGVTENRDSVVLWRLVKCVPKGQG